MNPQWLQKESAARSRSSPLRKAECKNEPALPIGTSLHFGSSPLHPQGWIFWNCPFLAAPGGGAVAPFFAGVWSFQVLPGYEPRLYSQWFSNAAILSQVSLHFIGMDRILKNPLEKDRPGFVKNKINIAWIRKKKDGWDCSVTGQWLYQMCWSWKKKENLLDLVQCHIYLFRQFFREEFHSYYWPYLIWRCKHAHLGDSTDHKNLEL